MVNHALQFMVLAPWLVALAYATVQLLKPASSFTTFADITPPNPFLLDPLLERTALTQPAVLPNNVVPFVQRGGFGKLKN